MAAAARRKKEEVPNDDKPNLAPVVHKKPKANGLWVNWEFLRSLTKRPPRTTLHKETLEEYNRLLELADVALGRQVERRKTEKRVIAFRKSDRPKKRK